MGYVTQGWGNFSIAVLGGFVIAIHETGLRRINRRSTAHHAHRRRRRLQWSYGAIAIFVLSICSPLEYWSMQYFWIHMLQHISVMLLAPAMYVAGQPFVSLIHALPVRPRRRILLALFVTSRRHFLLKTLRLATSPWVAVALFNTVMIVWMVPVIFNPVMANENLHIWLMLSTFFISGVLFWLQLIPSRPFAPSLSPYGQVKAVVGSNIVMTVLAIAISFMTSTALYRFGSQSAGMVGMPGMAPVTHITMNPFVDQQIGAGILWVCGDFWAFPILFVAVRRMMESSQQSSHQLDRLTGGTAPTTFRDIDLT